MENKFKIHTENLGLFVQQFQHKVSKKNKKRNQFFFKEKKLLKF
jgi:hypothetical protein